MIEAGYYKGKIVGYGMRATKDGALSPTIKFSTIDQAGNPCAVFWQKSISTQKAMSYTLKELVICGLKTADDFAALADGLPAGVLDTSKDYNITVIIDNYDGKTIPKVSWINENKGDGDMGDQFAITRAKTEAMLSTIDISSAFDTAFAAIHKTSESSEPAPF